ncbi:MAG: DUF3102 domain-containing protein [Caldilineaceae bacterium]|nr:DUF3102 domain-containing protein [Caldilineaceae bacterium]
MPPRTPLSNRHTAMALATDSAPLDTSRLRYDYDQVDAEHRQQVMAAAVEIKANSDRVRDGILTIGKRLIEVKDFLPHGKFGEWIGQEFDLSLRMAQNMMNVAREYGDKSETVSLLSDSVLYLLAAPSTPPEARAEIETKAQETGKSPSRSEARHAIQKHKPEPVRYAPVWELESKVNAWMPTAGFGDLDILLHAVRHLVEGKVTVDSLLKSLEGVTYRKSDLKQAINNVISQRSTAQRQAQARTVYVGPEPDKTPDRTPLAALEGMVWEWVTNYATDTARDPLEVLLFLETGDTTRADKVRNAMIKWLRSQGCEWGIGELQVAVKRVHSDRRQAQAGSPLGAAYMEPEETLRAQRDAVAASGESLYDIDVRNLVTCPPHDGNFKMSLERATVTALLEAWNKIPEEGNKAKRNLIEKRMHARAISHEPVSFAYQMTPAPTTGEGKGIIAPEWSIHVLSNYAPVNADFQTALAMATPEQLQQALDLAVPGGTKVADERYAALQARLHELEQPATSEWDAGAVGLPRDWTEEEFEDYVEANAFILPEPADPRIAQAQEMLDVYLKAQQGHRLYTELTGRDLDTIPLRRALEPMIERLQSLLRILTDGLLPIKDDPQGGVADQD